MFDPEEIKSKLQILRQLRGARRIFGAGAHRFRLARPLSRDEMAEVEGRLKVTFPEEYRRYLLELGRGGAGPYYGVFILDRVEGRWGWQGDGVNLVDAALLAKPFPHQGPATLKDHPIWAECPDEDQVENADEFFEAYGRWKERFNAVYWGPQLTQGALCLCHLGCAVRHWLVVTGPERGNMWGDVRVDEGGLFPLSLPGQERLGFHDWYMRWLNAAIVEAEGGRVNWTALYGG